MALSINKQKEKDWDNLIKQVAKTNGWKFKSRFAYKTINDFFYEANFYTSGIDNSLRGSLQFKPLIIDEVFWEIVGLQDNKKMPLSFRGNGAFTIGAINIFLFEFKVISDNLKTEIRSLFEKINHKVDELQSTIVNLDAFVSFIEQHPNDNGGEWFYNDMLIVTYIVQKKYDKALLLLDYAKKKRGMCSWEFGDKNFYFYDLAIEYCLKHT